MAIQRYLQIHPMDNVLVALQDLGEGTTIVFEGKEFTLKQAVAAKHKFTIQPMEQDTEILMYGVLVGKLNTSLAEGELITTENLRHASEDFRMGKRKTAWTKPDVSAFKDKTFNGFHRSNGTVGTANYWLVIPLVFCENRNVLTLKAAFEEKLGYKVMSMESSF